ncbi:hypothetical protein HPA12_10670 [Streptococcus suis]|nr:hypothetical protein [Streptococcus suis]
MQIKIRISELFYLLICYYQVTSFYWGGLFYRLSDKNKFIYLFIDFLIMFLFILLKQQKFTRNGILVFSIPLIVFGFHTILSNNASLKELIVMYLIATKITIFYTALDNLGLNKVFDSIINVGILNIIIGLIELLSQGRVNPFVPLYTVAQRVEALNKAGTTLSVYRGGFEHPLVTAVMLTCTLVFYFKIKHLALKVFCILMQLYLIFGTEKRTGMFLSIILMVLYFIIKAIFIDKNYKRVRTIFVFSFIFVILAILSQFIKVSDQTLYQVFISKFTALQSTENFSLLHRTTSFTKSIDIIFSQNIFRLLLGNGFNFLPLYMASNGLSITTLNFLVIDNSYMSLLADFGILSLILVSSYLVFTVSYLFGFLSQSIKIENKIEIILVFIATMVLFSSAFLFDILNWYQGIWMIALIVAFCEYLKRKEYFYDY